eukprot:sb/3472813/
MINLFVCLFYQLPQLTLHRYCIPITNYPPPPKPSNPYLIRHAHLFNVHGRLDNSTVASTRHGCAHPLVTMKTGMLKVIRKYQQTLQLIIEMVPLRYQITVKSIMYSWLILETAHSPYSNDSFVESQIIGQISYFIRAGQGVSLLNFEFYRRAAARPRAVK